MGRERRYIFLRRSLEKNLDLQPESMQRNSSSYFLHAQQLNHLVSRHTAPLELGLLKHQLLEGGLGKVCLSSLLNHLGLDSFVEHWHVRSILFWVNIHHLQRYVGTKIHC